jgi:hypothetical protein
VASIRSLKLRCRKVTALELSCLDILRNEHDQSVLQSAALDQHLSPSHVQNIDGLAHGSQHSKGNAVSISSGKGFPQRGHLCLHRLVKLAAFTCSRCSLGKTSKLVAFNKSKWDEPVCNGCTSFGSGDNGGNGCPRPAGGRCLVRRMGRLVGTMAHLGGRMGHLMERMAHRRGSRGKSDKKDTLHRLRYPLDWRTNVQTRMGCLW